MMVESFVNKARGQQLVGLLRTLPYVFSLEFFDFFQNNFLLEHLQTSTYVYFYVY